MNIDRNWGRSKVMWFYQYYPAIVYIYPNWTLSMETVGRAVCACVSGVMWGFGGLVRVKVHKPTNHIIKRINHLITGIERGLLKIGEREMGVSLLNRVNMIQRSKASEAFSGSVCVCGYVCIRNMNVYVRNM